MIGVLCDAGESAVVEEFFQLFKTPWEAFVAGRSYDVLLTTRWPVPECEARLILFFWSEACLLDTQWGIRPAGRKQGATLEVEDLRLPSYGEVLTFEGIDDADACVRTDGRIAGFGKALENGTRVVRLGYDLFKEVLHLLSRGQPLENASVPTLDLHIDLLRRWIFKAGLSLVEIPPFPAGNSFIVCLTHDIDFIGIRRHLFDHTMWGFLLRSTVGALQRLLRGKIGPGRLFRCWAAAGSLPLIYLGWLKDFWLPFPWYMKVEKDLPATYYLIPFKGRAGKEVPSRRPERRATAYDVSDISDWVQTLQETGCEIGVHGIDAWRDAEEGKAERFRVSSVTGESNVGIRMHWLLSDADTPKVIEDAGYNYDATIGYNEIPGYRTGTNQVYRPSGATSLLELPLHIQDGALFYPKRLDLPEDEAWKVCDVFIGRARANGGVLTILWHDRSHGPERFWGDFYVRLVNELKSLDPWFGTAREVVEWFRSRRSVTFERSQVFGEVERVVARCEGKTPVRPFVLRVHGAREERLPAPSIKSPIDVPWPGEDDIEVSSLMQQRQPEKSPASRPLDANGLVAQWPLSDIVHSKI